MKNKHTPLCAIIAEILLAALCVSAQTYKASLLGRITDPAGAQLSGAKITATNIETNISASTHSDGDGNYLIPQLLPGKYRVTIEAAGFKSFAREAVTLEVDRG
jgi:hypothetical protein